MRCAAIDIGSGNIYLGGPPLVKAATGEVVTGEELGGAVVLSHGPGWNGDVTISRSNHALLCEWNHWPFCQRWGREFCHYKVNRKSGLNVVAIFISRDVIASLNLSPTPPVELGGTPPLYSSEGLEVLAGKKALEKEDVMALLARVTDNSRCNLLPSAFRADNYHYQVLWVQGNVWWEPDLWLRKTLWPADRVPGQLRPHNCRRFSEGRSLCPGKTWKDLDETLTISSTALWQ